MALVEIWTCLVRCDTCSPPTCRCGKPMRRFEGATKFVCISCGHATASLNMFEAGMCECEEIVDFVITPEVWPFLTELGVEVQGRFGMSAPARTYRSRGG